MTPTGHNARTGAIIAHMQRQRIERETQRETLPPEVKLVIEQLVARVARLEAINQALVSEAAKKVGAG